MSKKLIGLFLIPAVLMTAAGCATLASHPLKSIRIQANSVDSIRVEGRTVTLSKLVSTLKSAGAVQGTIITVSVAQDAPPPTAKLIRDSLVSGGLPKVVIALQRPPTAVVAPVKTR